MKAAANQQTQNAEQKLQGFRALNAERIACLQQDLANVPPGLKGTHWETDRQRDLDAALAWRERNPAPAQPARNQQTVSPRGDTRRQPKRKARRGAPACPEPRLVLSPWLPQSRPPLRRMMAIHERLKASAAPGWQRRVNCSSLAAELEVSVKTVQRDVDFMRDSLALPLEFDASRRTFRYTRAVNVVFGQDAAAAPAPPPEEKVTVNLLNPDGSLWLRVHLEASLWDAVERLAARDGVSPEQLVNRGLLAAFDKPASVEA